MSINDTFYFNDIYYIITSISPREVSVNTNQTIGGNITIPNNVSYNNNSYSVTSIVDLAFYQNYNLKEIYLPTSLKSIGADAFYECINLEIIDLSSCIPLTQIGTGCFGLCSSLTNVQFTTSITSIGSNAFLSCTSLEVINLSNCTSLSNLGEGCFGFCTSLTTVQLPTSLTSIGLNSFLGCSNLKNIDLSKCLSLTNLDQGCFDFCTSLSIIIIPASVTSIGQGAFYSCTSLSSVIFLSNTIPSLISDSFLQISNPSTAFYQSGVVNLDYLKSFNFFTNYIELPNPNPSPNPNQSINFSYPVYSPYLQPTSSLGTGARISGAISIGSRPKYGGLNRIYNYYHSLNQEENFLNNVVFQIYGKKINN